MPVCFIAGPDGLTQNSKKELINETLRALVAAYQMPDDRVFISDYAVINVGHTAQTEEVAWSIQAEQARPVCRIDAPPGLPVEARRKLVQTITNAVSKAYKISDLRDVLIFLQEYPIEHVANNGVLQNENPEFESPVAR